MNFLLSLVGGARLDCGRKIEPEWVVAEAGPTCHDHEPTAKTRADLARDRRRGRTAQEVGCVRAQEAGGAASQAASGGAAAANCRSQEGWLGLCPEEQERASRDGVAIHS